MERICHREELFPLRVAQLKEDIDLDLLIIGCYVYNYTLNIVKKSENCFILKVSL